MRTISSLIVAQLIHNNDLINASSEPVVGEKTKTYNSVREVIYELFLKNPETRPSIFYNFVVLIATSIVIASFSIFIVYLISKVPSFRNKPFDEIQYYILTICACVFFFNNNVLIYHSYYNDFYYHPSCIYSNAILLLLLFYTYFLHNPSKRARAFLIRLHAFNFSSAVTSLFVCFSPIDILGSIILLGDNVTNCFVSFLRVFEITLTLNSLESSFKLQFFSGIILLILLEILLIAVITRLLFKKQYDLGKSFSVNKKKLVRRPFSKYKK